MYIYIYTVYLHAKFPSEIPIFHETVDDFPPIFPIFESSASWLAMRFQVPKSAPAGFRQQKPRVFDSMGKLKVKKRQNIWCCKMALLDIKLVKHNVVYLLCFF